MSALNCTEFERLLRESVEAWRPADARLSEHAALCATCRPEWDRHILLEQATAAWVRQTPGCDLADAVLAILADDHGPSNGAAPAPAGRIMAHRDHPPMTPRRPARTLRDVSGAAAVVAVAGVVLLLVSQALLRPVRPLADRPLAGPTPMEQEQPAPMEQEQTERVQMERQPAEVAQGPSVAVEPPIDPSEAEPPAELVALAQEAGTAWRALTDRTVAAMREGASFVPPVDRLFVSQVSEERVPRGTADDRQPPQLRRQLAETVEFLMDVWPWDDESTL